MRAHSHLDLPFHIPYTWGEHPPITVYIHTLRATPLIQRPCLQPTRYTRRPSLITPPPGEIE